MKLFKFLAIFLLVLGFVYLIVLGLNWSVFKTVFQNQEALADGSEWVEKTYSLKGLVEYIYLQPEHVSVVMKDVNDPESGIKYGENIPRVLGTTSNLFILLEYARQIEARVLSADELVDITSVTRYQLPGYESNRERETINYLTKEGWLQNNRISMEHLVRAMITRNYLPAADFLIHRLGLDRVRNYAHNIGKNRIEAPIPFSGLYMASLESFESREDFQTQALRQARQIHKDGFRDNMKINLSFNDERALYRNFPAGEPEALSEVLLMIWNDELPGSEIVKSILNWPMDDGKLDRNLSDFGAIFDRRISLLTGVGFGTSAYTGQTFVQVIIFDDLPVGFWMHLSANLMNQDLQQRIIFDPALYAEVSKLIKYNIQNEVLNY